MTDGPPGRPASGLPIGRRTLLKAGLVGTIGALGAAACGGSGTRATSSGTSAPATSTTTGPATTTTTLSASTTEGLDGSAWQRLGASLSGRLALPTSSGYLSDVQCYDFRYDGTRPAAVAYCASADDVARCMAFARDHGITPTPRGGGHSYGGYSVSSGLVIDVTPMNQLQPGPTAVIGAGVRLIDMYNGCNAAGVSIPGGSCPTVGISGLALGGGLGVVGRLHGLTCDAISSLQVVTADSRTVTASPAVNSDLYWACRGGGGGNFGIVTEFAFSTFPTSEVALFTLDWPWAAAGQLLPAWQHWAPGAPDALWSNCLLGASGQGPSPSIRVTGVYVGPEAQLTSLLAPLIAAVGTPSGQYMESTTFAHAMFVEGGCAELSLEACHLPTQSAGGTLPRTPGVAKSDFLTTPLSDAGVQVVLDALDARQRQGLSGAVGYDALGGAISRVAADATAFVHRNAICSAQYSVTMEQGDSPGFIAQAQAWLDGFYAELRPYVSGQAYQNYIDPTLADWAQAYYGTNLARLSEVKAKWDPDDAFHFAQSIPLS